MSALGGVLGPVGSRVDRSRVHRLSASLAHRGPDGLGVAWGSSVAMVFRPFHSTFPPGRCAQPFRGSGDATVLWDGRLDNREDLGRELGLQRQESDREDSNREERVLLAGYERWEADLPSKLLGDFALAVWDERRRRLLLARDRFGVRPLFYCRIGRLFLWASTLGALLDQGADPGIDDEFVAEFLTFTRFSDRTPYRSIRAVAPGTTVVVEEGGTRERRYWPTPRSREIRYRTDEEYEEHFEEVFRNAVGCRLQDKTACAELSGGVDSSSIVVVADELIEEGRCPSTRLETLSYVFDQASTSDERRFSTLVEEWRGQTGHHIREDDHRLLRPLDKDLRIDLPTTELFFARRNQAAREIMDRVGARTLIRGIGGDQALWGQSPYPFELADHLARLQLGRLARSLRRWSRAKRTSRLELLIGGALYPHLPHRWRSSFGNNFEVSAWFDRGWLHKVDLAAKMAGPRNGGGFPLPSQREHFRFLQTLAISASWGGFFVPSGQVEIAYPFLDVRVVDFALGIPIEQMVRPGETRSILRRTLRSRLPEKVLHRRSKAGPDEALLRALDREWDRLAPLFHQALVYEYGFVAREAFRQALTMARHGRVSDAPMLFRIIALEWWLRSLARRNRDHSSSTNPRKEVRPHGDPESRNLQCA